MAKELSEFREIIERAFEQDRASHMDRVEVRACSSDRYDGIQVNVYGEFVSARTAIDCVAEMPGAGIESLHHSSDGEPHLGFFVAQLPEQPHPGLVEYQ